MTIMGHQKARAKTVEQDDPELYESLHNAIVITPIERQMHLMRALLNRINTTTEEIQNDLSGDKDSF